MAISLEVKKFVNTEYVGKFAEIELPIAQPEDEEPQGRPERSRTRRIRRKKRLPLFAKGRIMTAMTTIMTI